MCRTMMAVTVTGPTDLRMPCMQPPLSLLSCFRPVCQQTLLAKSFKNTRLHTDDQSAPAKVGTFKQSYSMAMLHMLGMAFPNWPALHSNREDAHIAIGKFPDKRNLDICCCYQHNTVHAGTHICRGCQETSADQDYNTSLK